MTANEKTDDLATRVQEVLDGFGVPSASTLHGTLEVTSPISGETIGRVKIVSAADVGSKIEAAHAAFLQWRDVPPPKRGELVRLLGEELRANKAALGKLASIETGKIVSEGLGGVQEMVDICDL